jgi:alkylation response protein AidB-like acyl-CoA dehydrogenase
VELDLTDDQAFFQETTRKFLAAECPITAVRALEHEPAGFGADYWRRGAELGWTSMLVAEVDGGGSLSEHGLLDLVLVAEEMGRAVAPGPLVPVSIVASTLSRSGTADQKAEVLPGLLSGAEVAAWAQPTNVCEASRPLSGRGASETLLVGVVATRRGDDVVLSGVAAPVEAGAQAQHLLVSASTVDGPMQLLVAANAPGLTIIPMGGLDLVRRFAQVRFDNVRVPASAVIGPVGGAAEDIERQLQIAVALQCAETVGAMDHIFAMTLEYMSDRYSFGRPLSSYQALKHRVADDKMWLEACHATATAAANAVAAEASNAGELVSAAKAWIGPHATELIQDAVQLHGGIGVTWEHDLHLYLRRATVNRATYGTPEEHAERVATVVLGAAS